MIAQNRHYDPVRYEPAHGNTYAVIMRWNNRQIGTVTRLWKSGSRCGWHALGPDGQERGVYEYRQQAAWALMEAR